MGITTELKTIQYQLRREPRTYLAIHVSRRPARRSDRRPTDGPDAAAVRVRAGADREHCAAEPAGLCVREREQRRFAQPVRAR